MDAMAFIPPQSTMIDAPIIYSGIRDKFSLEKPQNLLCKHHQLILLP